MKKLGNIGGIISGVISIIFSFVVVGKSTGSFERNSTYGGDAYTGIQNAAAQAANNTQDLAEIVRFGLFGFLFVFGLALICFFLTRLAEDAKPAAPAGPAFYPNQMPPMAPPAAYPNQMNTASAAPAYPNQMNTAPAAYANRPNTPPAAAPAAAQQNSVIQ